MCVRGHVHMCVTGVMYICVLRISTLSLFLRFSLGIWICSDRVVFCFVDFGFIGLFDVYLNSVSDKKNLIHLYHRIFVTKQFKTVF
jgi:hypothetical protein